jgi:hypothetical protein
MTSKRTKQSDASDEATVREIEARWRSHESLSEWVALPQTLRNLVLNELSSAADMFERPLSDQARAFEQAIDVLEAAPRLVETVVPSAAVRDVEALLAIVRRLEAHGG